MSIPSAASAWFQDLQQDRAWWQAHKDDYRRDVGDPLRALLDDLAEEFGGDVKLFRPHRDTRFGGPPLRDHALGGLGKPDAIAVRYIRIDASGTVVGAGAPAPDRHRLTAIRSAVVADGAAARAALALPGLDLPDEPLRTAPRGIPRDAPDLDLLRRTRWTAERHLGRGTVDRDTIRRAWHDAEPLVAWLRDRVRGVR